jgi:hypothetical protein
MYQINTSTLSISSSLLDTIPPDFFPMEENIQLRRGGVVVHIMGKYYRHEVVGQWKRLDDTQFIIHHSIDNDVTHITLVLSFMLFLLHSLRLPHNQGANSQPFVVVEVVFVDAPSYLSFASTDADDDDDAFEFWMVE